MEPHIIPPNLNGKVYREFFPKQSPINQFLDFIDICENNILLGSSNLNGRYWNGSMCYYKNASSPTNFKLDTPFIHEYHDVGVTDGKIVPKTNKVIISTDSGQVKLFEIEENNMEWLESDLEEHDDTITEISLWPDNNFVTGSFDASIKLWNISSENRLVCLHTYIKCHSNIISSVAANKNDNNLFASCSYDHYALLWDKRTKEPGNVIYENEFCAVTRVEWHPNKPNLLAVSTSSGDIYLIDVRDPLEFLAKKTCFERSIHKTQFNNDGLLAICADDSKIIVLDCGNEDMKVTYMDDTHLDFVRGLTWNNNVLISCGWDKKVLFHYL